MTKGLGSVSTSVHADSPEVEAHSTEASHADAARTKELLVPSESLENIVREVNRLLMALCAKKLNTLYQLFDLIDKEQERAVEAYVGTYRDRTVFWLQMASCGIQAFSVVTTAAPQVCPPVADGINNLTERLLGVRPIDMDRFLERSAAGILEFNYNKVAKAADKVLSFPPQILDAVGKLNDQTMQGGRAEKQSLMDRLSAILSQRRQECQQEIQKEEEARRNYQQAVHSDDQIRQQIAAR